MNSLVLQTAARFLLPLLLLFSIFLLLRGHNEPGGGFAGGLVAAAAFALFIIAYDVESARESLRVDPHTLIGGGLLVAILSGTLSLFTGRPFMTGLWVNIRLPGEVTVTVGTPLLFDIGVYLVVIGATLLIIIALSEE